MWEGSREVYDPFLHLSRGHYYTAQPCSGNLRHLPSLLNHLSFRELAHGELSSKKPKSVNLCSAQLISASGVLTARKQTKKPGPDVGIQGYHQQFVKVS